MHPPKKGSIFTPMFRPVDTRVPDEVEQQVQAIYSRLFPDADLGLVSRAFTWAKECFSGQYEDYSPIDAKYHDFEHTLQGTLCLSRLLHGRHVAGAQPTLSRQLFELGLLGILFHDSGYLKKRTDPSGTGAKYTLVHVSRSAEFARDFLAQRGYSHGDTSAVQNMISCTGVTGDLHKIPFRTEAERLVGYALGTADLLGQMAAHDYVDKLPVLYLEFAEANQFSSKEKTSHLTRFGSAADLMAQTPAFWTDFVRPRIQNDFKQLFTFLNDPYPDGPNPYIQRIEQNLARLGKPSHHS